MRHFILRHLRSVSFYAGLTCCSKISFGKIFGKNDEPGRPLGKLCLGLRGGVGWGGCWVVVGGVGADDLLGGISIIVRFDTNDGKKETDRIEGTTRDPLVDLPSGAADKQHPWCVEDMFAYLWTEGA